MEGLEDRVVACCRQGCHEESGSHTGAPATDEALALPLTGLAGPGGQAGQRGHLTTIEASQFGDLREQHPGRERADARDGGKQILLLAPDRRAANAVIDLLVDIV